MGLKKYKPKTASLRFTTLSDFAGISRKRPERRLRRVKKSQAGRNSQGRITIRHRGGGHKKFLRLVDFRRHDKLDIPAKVQAIEYDPNRTARLALLAYADGEKRYILAPNGLQVGVRLLASPQAEPVDGNALPLSAIPIGMPIHAIELIPGGGAKLARSAGMVARIAARDETYAHIKLPSGEIRKLNAGCYATIGQVGNLEHENISLGKAGRKRWKGIRPTVRGVAMNPVDHPMGGGEGRSSGGGHPVTPWGQLTKGKRTRSGRKSSGKFIVQRRKK
ncbi:MAG: 50S ribosomal protein L2 [Kiritimatiellae bacterium]|jgi:large subunit ribosomal protein L2|nr:50S ribosomal protein L2 [Kiritimatiellia bacterium]NLD90803.1 50S ribosomal protein L2 [Lentisphaerota bacterium]HPC20679.1 50S ribosomal protein L2 [Kiritimatiellia bacterium]HQN80945.1 50S ribosomal protein L2 [Kiritimatiellia bacterium]